jgi:hypothetical protein
MGKEEECGCGLLNEVDELDEFPFVFLFGVPLGVQEGALGSWIDWKYPRIERREKRDGRSKTEWGGGSITTPLQFGVQEPSIPTIRLNYIKSS